MKTRAAFFPNLDADAELGTSGSYQPRKETLVAIARQTPALQSLIGEFPLLERSTPVRYDPQVAELAICWCPTKHAREVLGRAGWPLPRAPTQDILRRVNDRRFLLAHGPNDVGRRWVDRSTELTFLGSGPFRLKRPFGFAGRGQRVVGRVLSRDDRRWIEDSLHPGFSCEPEFELQLELSIHGYVDEAGLLLGTPCQFECDRHGSVVHFERTASRKYDAALRSVAEDVAAALSAEGYFGPFGIDAFVANTPKGELLNPLSDLNARFTLAWSVGMGPLRDAALERLCKSPGDD